MSNAAEPFTLSSTVEIEAALLVNCNFAFGTGGGGLLGSAMAMLGGALGLVMAMVGGGALNVGTAGLGAALKSTSGLAGFVFCCTSVRGICHDKDAAEPCGPLS